MPKQQGLEIKLFKSDSYVLALGSFNLYIKEFNIGTVPECVIILQEQFLCQSWRRWINDRHGKDLQLKC